VVGTFHVLHCLVFVASSGVLNGGQLGVNVDFFSVEKEIDNLSDLEVSLAEPACIASWVLRL
jgi:hypothetical protein